MANNENVIAESLYTIGRAIAAKLKLGDVGKVDSFLGRITKDLKRAVEIEERELSTLNFNHKGDLSDLKDRLEDANTDLALAFEAIIPEQVATNDLQIKFADTYLEGLDMAEMKVESIELETTVLKEEHAAQVEAKEKAISKLKKRLKTIK
jgi:hypothetical protein